MLRRSTLAILRIGERSAHRGGLMSLRVLLAIASPVFRETIRKIADVAADLLLWPVEIDQALDALELQEKLPTHPATLVLLDWDWAGEETSSLIPRMFEWNRSVRVVVLLPPGASKGYRSALWAVGACASTPRDRLDEEWMVTILCLVRRAMEREGLLPSELPKVSEIEG